MEYTLLHDVRDAFYTSRPEAKKGKKLIDDFFKKEDYWGLAELLRHHNEEWGYITTDETWDRDYIDYFIESFSLLSICHLADLNNGDIPSDIRKEINSYLGDKIIRKYYTKNYPLLLPQIICSAANYQNSFKIPNAKTDEENSIFYNKFIHLNNFISNQEVDDFLWLLDGGWKEIDISDFKKTISSQKKIEKLFKSAGRQQEKKVFSGFIKYLNFLHEFKQFLDLMDGEPLLQSLYWHYHGYWFDKSHTHMSKVIKIFFKSLKSANVHATDKSDVGKYLAIVSKMESQYLKVWNTLCRKSIYKKPLILHYESLVNNRYS
jgi:hypothetical protein